MTKKTISDDQGPLLGHLPLAPNAATRLLLVEKLGGHTTSLHWLPEGLSPELDQLRAEMLRLRAQLVAILEQRAAVLAEHAREDKRHAEALKAAAREGSNISEDSRTSAEQRDRDLAAVDERVWATISVLAECADAVIEHIREHEDYYLSSLRLQLEPLAEKREEAARLVAEAESEAWRCHRIGSWLQNTADDEGGLGRQPAPALVAPPKQFNRELLKDSLQRPWHKKDKSWHRQRSAA